MLNISLWYFNYYICILFSGDTGPFEIDSSTGYLSSNAAIVFADASSYSLTLTATDSGGLTSTATVDITVIEGMLPRKCVSEIRVTMNASKITISRDNKRYPKWGLEIEIHHRSNAILLWWFLLFYVLVLNFCVICTLRLHVYSKVWVTE